VLTRVRSRRTSRRLYGPSFRDSDELFFDREHQRELENSALVASEVAENLARTRSRRVIKFRDEMDEIDVDDVVFERTNDDDGPGVRHDSVQQ
jgi:hypothetical protein